MALRRVVLRTSKSCRVALRCAFQSLPAPRVNVQYARRGIFTTAALLFCEAKQKIDLKSPDENSLKEEAMLKAASANVADTVTTLLSQTTYSLIEMEQKYRDMVTALIQLLEYHIDVLGNAAEEQRMLGIIAEAKGWLDAYHKHITDLEMLLSSVQKVADASAEVAFLTGSEFTSTSLGERMYHASHHIAAAREQRRKAEAELQEVEAQRTKAMAKHAEREERQKQAEDAMFGADLTEGLEEGEKEPSEKDLPMEEEVTESAESHQQDEEDLDKVF